MAGIRIVPFLGMLPRTAERLLGDGRAYVMNKDTQPVNLLANAWHEIEALEDGTVFVNVFAEGKL